MKPILNIILFLLIINITFAFPAGTEQVIKTFDKCEDLTVNVKGELVINDSEYWFIDCEQTENNTWQCDCHDDYDLIMNTKITTINNYTINMEWSYNEKTYTSTSSSSSGFSSLPENYILEKKNNTNQTKEKDKKEEIVQQQKPKKTNSENKDSKQDINKQTDKEQEIININNSGSKIKENDSYFKETQKDNTYLFAIICCIVFGVGYYFFKDKKKNG